MLTGGKPVDLESAIGAGLETDNLPDQHEWPAGGLEEQSLFLPIVIEEAQLEVRLPRFPPRPTGANDNLDRRASVKHSLGRTTTIFGDQLAKQKRAATEQSHSTARLSADGWPD